KVYYNIMITGLSVAVALVIGTIELVSIIADQLGISSGPLAAIAHLDLNHVGYVIVGLFVLTWIVALLVWRYARIEDRWTAGLAASDSNCPRLRSVAAKWSGRMGTERVVVGLDNGGTANNATVLEFSGRFLVDRLVETPSLVLEGPAVAVEALAEAFDG